MAAKTKRKTTKPKYVKPSQGLTKAERSKVAFRAAAGEPIRIGKTTFEEVYDKALVTYGDPKTAKQVAASVMWKNLAKQKKTAKAQHKKFKF